MFQKIKQLADEAVALQNKDRMDAALRKISVVCGQLADSEALTSSSSDTAFPFDRAKPDAVDTAVDPVVIASTVKPSKKGGAK